MKGSQSSPKDKIVLVTGGASGLGLAVCRGFAAQGYTVILSDKSRTEGKRAARELRESGNARVHYSHCDLSSMRSIDQLVAEVEEGLGHIDVLVNNCRAGTKKSFLDETEKNWDLNCDTMMKACFFLSQKAIGLIRPGGAILNISSVLSCLVGGESPSYHAAKAGLEQVTRYLAVMCGKKDVRVNAMAPGFIVKAPHLERFNSRKNARYRDVACFCHPAGEIGLEDDIANCALFLCSPAARFVTGQVLVVDGGLTIQEPSTLLLNFAFRKK